MFDKAGHPLKYYLNEKEHFKLLKNINFQITSLQLKLKVNLT